MFATKTGYFWCNRLFIEFFDPFNLFLMDSAAKMLLKYVKNIISSGNSTSSIQLDPKFGKKILFKFPIVDT